jgi:hypothetical protein
VGKVMLLATSVSRRRLIAGLPRSHGLNVNRRLRTNAPNESSVRVVKDVPHWSRGFGQCWASMAANIVSILWRIGIHRRPALSIEH